MRIYLAGPMTGIAQFNFPAFDEAAVTLRERDYDVVLPADMDSEEIRAIAFASRDGNLSAFEGMAKKTWGDLLAADVKLIADDGIQGIVCLEGWEQSRGARLETYVASLCGVPIAIYQPEGALNFMHCQATVVRPND